MKRNFLFILLAVVCLVGNAQLLWRVSGNGLKEPSYIFGTHHFAPVSVIDTLKGFSTALQSSRAVVCEIEADSMKSPQATQLMMRFMAAPPDSGLSKILSPAQYAKVDSVVSKYLGAYGVKLSQMEGVKPVVISTQLVALQCAKVMPNRKPDEQLDVEIQARAKQEGKPVIGLETVAFQANLIFNSPIKDQAHDLLEACQKDEEFAHEVDELNKAYLAQDLAKVEEAMLEDIDASQAERVLYSRNRTWAGELPAIMAKQPVLVAVGAGHLPGTKGLIALLRKAGYKLEPVHDN